MYNPFSMRYGVAAQTTIRPHCGHNKSPLIGAEYPNPCTLRPLSFDETQARLRRSCWIGNHPGSIPSQPATRAATATPEPLPVNPNQTGRAVHLPRDWQCGTSLSLLIRTFIEIRQMNPGFDAYVSYGSSVRINHRGVPRGVQRAIAGISTLPGAERSRELPVHCPAGPIRSMAASGE